MIEEIIKPPGQFTKTYVHYSVAEMISLTETFIKHLSSFRHNASLDKDK